MTFPVSTCRRTSTSPNSRSVTRLTRSNHHPPRRSKSCFAKPVCVLKLSYRWGCISISSPFVAAVICRCGTFCGSGGFSPGKRAGRRRFRQRCWDAAGPHPKVSSSATTAASLSDCGSDHASTLPVLPHARGILEGIDYYQFLDNIVIPNDRIEPPPSSE